MLYEFTLVLTGSPVGLDQVEAIYGGLDDSTIVTKGGVSRVHVDREAESLESAIRSAIGQVVAAGLTVDRVEIEADQFAAAGAS